MADPTITSHNATAPRVEPGATVQITLDGKEMTTAAGQFLIAAAEEAGVFIPRFCYHPRMKPVGMCRMCLVEVSGPRGATLQPACYVPVADGMEVVTTSDKVRKAQDSVLEFLLVNHPLDCPVCDKGGECPLQDQVIAYGPGESRFLEEKRHWAKPIALSELVLLDRERCIQCGRCVRFATEIAGEPQIDFLGRGDALEVNIFEEHPFSSYFSGNTVQICPVGALTATPYRFSARPWDLDQVESTCTTCAFGCRVAVQASSNRVTRLLGIDADPVNQSWLCDKGRFGYEAANSADRLSEPLMRPRPDAELEVVSWAEALNETASRLARLKAERGPASIGVVGGARLSNEDAYAWAKLAKAVIGTDNVDAQLGDGLPAELVVGLPRATIDQACTAPLVVTLCGDLREELPVLYLRLRGALDDGTIRLVELSARSTALSAQCSASLRYRPGELRPLVEALGAAGGGRSSAAPPGIDSDAWAGATAAAQSAGPDGTGVVVVLGRPSLAEHEAVVGEAALALAEAWPQALFLPALRRGNVMGALDMGMAPGLLPGRVGLEEGRAWFEAAWGSVPTQPGHDTGAMLRAVADGHMAALVLVGADVLGDFPDRRLAEEALEAAELVVAVDTFLSPTSARADIVLPTTGPHERGGTTTNIEGRVTRLGQKLVAPGQCWPDWMVAAELAARLGSDLGVADTSELWDEIERLAPSHAGVTRSVLDGPSGQSGVVCPLPSMPVQLRPMRPIDPMATPGIESVERQGAAPRVGLAEPAGAEVANGAPRPTGAVRPSTLAPPRHLDVPAVPSGDAAGMRLVSARRLYDGGVMLEASESLAPLEHVAVARLHPRELERLGMASGSPLRLGSGDRSLVLEALADPGVPPGAVSVPFNLDVDGGPGASLLIDASAAVTEISVASP